MRNLITKIVALFKGSDQIHAMQNPETGLWTCSAIISCDEFRSIVSPPQQFASKQQAIAHMRRWLKQCEAMT